MSNLTQLFKFLEITRNQPQYGFALSGISKIEQSDLAQHQYLVAMIALQLGYYFNSQGAKLNIQQLLEICLTHDLAELLGGDINYYYARANPVAREKAKIFEEENAKYIAKMFGEYAKKFQENNRQFEQKETDEACLAQVADKIECIHFKLQLGKFLQEDIVGTKKSLISYAEKVKDELLKLELKKFIDVWASQMPGKSIIETIASEVKEFN